MPHIESNENNTNSKFIDVNNSAYVDSFFVFLSSNLIYYNKFIHGIDFYGSFLAIKNNYKLNVEKFTDYAMVTAAEVPGQPLLPPSNTAYWH